MAQALYIKTFPSTFLSDTLLVRRDGGTRRASPWSRASGLAASFQTLSPPHPCRVPPRIQSPSTCPPYSLLRTHGGGLQMIKGHLATTSRTRHFRPRPAQLQVPAAPAPRSALSHLRPKRVPELSARRQGLEIEQNRLMGEGEGGGRRGQPGWRTLRGCRKSELAFRLPLSTPQLLGAETSACAPRLQGARGRSLPGFFASSCQRSAAPSPASPSRPFPHSGANLRLRNLGSFAVHGRRRNTAHKPFPRSPRRRLLPVCGPWRRGEAKPRVAMEMRSGRGRGGPTTMTALRPGLALLVSPRRAQRSLFQLKDKEKKEFCHKDSV